jgi:hypothetical protein
VAFTFAEIYSCQQSNSIVESARGKRHYKAKLWVLSLSNPAVLALLKFIWPLNLSNPTMIVGVDNTYNVTLRRLKFQKMNCSVIPVKLLWPRFSKNNKNYGFINPIKSTKLCHKTIHFLPLQTPPTLSK